jgi:hypothetical protein
MERRYLRKCWQCKKNVYRVDAKPFRCSNCKDPYKSPLGWDRIRKAILKRDGSKCLLCGDSNKLHIHHIDKNRRNNSDKNLMTLCNQCHESQHGKNFEKPIGITFGQFGKRLIYQSDLKSNIITTREKRLPKRFFKNKGGDYK